MTNTVPLFILEGPDGVGKTSIAGSLTRALRSEGRTVSNFSFPGREWEGSLGRFVYDLHHAETSIDPTALQVAHVSAHIDSIVRRIRPALRRGEIVVLDRYWWSTIAYAESLGCDMAVVRAAVDAEKLAWGSILPARIFLVDRKRISDKVGVAHLGPSSDRKVEVDAAYDRLASSSPNVRRLSNDGTFEEAVAKVLESVRDGMEVGASER